MSRFPSLGDFLGDVLNLGFREGLVMGRSPKWERFPSKGGGELAGYGPTIGRSPVTWLGQNTQDHGSLCAVSAPSLVSATHAIAQSTRSC